MLSLATRFRKSLKTRTKPNLKKQFHPRTKEKKKVNMTKKAKEVMNLVMRVYTAQVTKRLSRKWSLRLRLQEMSR